MVTITRRRSRRSFVAAPVTNVGLQVALLVAVVFQTGLIALTSSQVCAANRPNFLLILADDLGYGDLACYGHPKIKTPNIDRLAAEGMRLTSCYAAAANCSPARAGLMTGRTPYRMGIHNWIPTFSPMHLKRQEITVASLLRDAGYETCHVGKWHLNGDLTGDKQPQPSDHGFDDWFATQNNALPNHRNPDNFVHNGRPVGQLDGFSAQIVARRAADWLRDERDETKPFFLFVCFHEPHEPIATARRFAGLYDQPDDQPADSSLAAHHGNVTQLDDGVGRVLQTLDDLQLRQDTMVFFTSDNGPAITGRHPHGSAGPLRDKKGFLYEGGIRVPGIIRWPGKTKAATTCDEPVCGVDFLPTVCEVTGISVPGDRAIDGTSFLPIFAGQPIRRATSLYWQFNFSRGKPKVAMRDGDWKILASLNVPDPTPTGDILVEHGMRLKQAELAEFELYHLSRDLDESNELSATHPERFERMAVQLTKLYREIRDESPVWPAWKWPRYEAGRIIWRGETKPRGN